MALVWIDSLRSRERALEAGRRACERYDLQLLDDTIAVVKIRFRRDDEGRLRVSRLYAFEFSDTGTNRRSGRIETLGSVVSDIQLEPYGDRGEAAMGDPGGPPDENAPRLRVVK